VAAAGSKNPLGALIVKFKGNLASAQMQAAVTQAGGGDRVGMNRPI